MTFFTIDRGSCPVEKTEVRIAKAWTALHKLNKIWSPKLNNNNIKIQFFRSMVESLLL